MNCISSFEPLSRRLSIKNMDNFFCNMSPSDVTNISCMQMGAIPEILSKSMFNYSLFANIKTHLDTLFNHRFLRALDHI